MYLILNLKTSHHLKNLERLKLPFCKTLFNKAILFKVKELDFMYLLIKK